MISSHTDGGRADGRRAIAEDVVVLLAFP